MKHQLFIFLLLTFGFTTYGQTPKELNLIISQINDTTQFIGDTAGLSKITLPTVEHQELDSITWHIQDLNFDGKTDLIYYGGPQYQTIVFLANEKGYVQEISEWGMLSEIITTDTSIILQTKLFACCCLYYHIYKQISITKNGHQVDHRVSIETTIPVPFYTEAYFTPYVSNLPLRSDSIINNEIWIDRNCTGDTLSGNIINVYSDSRELFLLTNNKNNHTNWGIALSRHSYSEKTYYKLGWIKLDSDN